MRHAPTHEALVSCSECGYRGPARHMRLLREAIGHEGWFCSYLCLISHGESEAHMHGECMSRILGPAYDLAVSAFRRRREGWLGSSHPVSQPRSPPAWCDWIGGDLSPAHNRSRRVRAGHSDMT